MNPVVTIKLKTSIVNRLEQKTIELKTNTDAIINKAIEDYFYFEKLNSLRKEVKGQAKKLGFENEENIFNNIS